MIASAYGNAPFGAKPNLKAALQHAGIWLNQLYSNDRTWTVTDDSVGAAAQASNHVCCMAATDHQYVGAPFFRRQSECSWWIACNNENFRGNARFKQKAAKTLVGSHLSFSVPGKRVSLRQFQWSRQDRVYESEMGAIFRSKTRGPLDDLLVVTTKIYGTHHIAHLRRIAR